MTEKKKTDHRNSSAPSTSSGQAPGRRAEKIAREKAARSPENIEAVKANKDDLAPAEKLALTGRMAADIAHGIRNALTNIVLSLLELKKDDIMKPEGLRYAEIMERNSKRIEYLVTRLLKCAPPIEPDLQPSHEKDVVRRIRKIRVKRIEPGGCKGQTVA